MKTRLRNTLSRKKKGVTIDHNVSVREITSEGNGNPVPELRRKSNVQTFTR